MGGQLEADLDISVVMGTFNRCELLAEAIERLRSQQADGLAFEIIIVDNNSTDRTRQVVESFRSDGHPQVRYLFEGRQGVAHARNCGILAARAPIIAFTDDDVRVASDWLVTIKQAFDRHRDVDMVGGKVLPRWERPPPGWLTQDHWSPLAILDFGDEPFYLDSQQPKCMLTANLAVRSRVFREIGLFNPVFQRVKDSIGSTEDHELLLRFYEQGKRGLYAPDVVAEAAVQNDRLTKAYHRRWHTGHGLYCALMGIEHKPDDFPRILGVPRHLYRRLFWFGRGWLVAVLRNNSSDALKHENALRYTVNYMRTLSRQAAAAKEIMAS